MIGRLGLAKIQQVLDEHPERGAPIADVVLACHSVSDVLHQTNERVTDDGGAQVTDVHFLGHVRCRVVDDHRARGDRADAETGVGGHFRQFVGQESVGEDEVQEARAGHLDRRADVLETATRLENCLSHLARIASEFLGQGQRTVGLGIGVFAEADDGIDTGTTSHGVERHL